MQSIDNVLKLRKGLKPDDPNPDIFDILWAKKLSGAAKDYTVTGNPLSFLAKKAQTAKSTKVTLSPVQDLHGYDNPWPAGSGKNKFSGVIYQADSTIDTSDGTIISNSDYDVYILPTLAVGDYTLSVLDSSDSSAVAKRAASYDTNDNLVGEVYAGNHTPSTTVRKGKNFTVPSGISYTLCSVRKTSYDIMVESGSIITDYAPYSNICPISGRTSVEIKGCKKNLVNNADIDIVENRYGVVFSVAGSYTIKAFIEPSVNQYIYARIKHSDGTFEDYKTIVQAKRIYSRKFVVAEGDVLQLYNASSGSSVENTAAIFNARQIMAVFGDTEPETYEAYAESNDVTITFPAVGKNLFDKVTCVFIPTAYISSTGEIESNGSYSYCETYIPVKPLTDYVFSGNIVSSSTTNSVAFYNNDKSFISRFQPSRGENAQFTTPENTRYIRFNVGKPVYNVDTIQIEEGTSATSYEPYTNTVYGGTLDVEKGEVKVNKFRFVFDNTNKINSISKSATEGSKAYYIYYISNTIAVSASLNLWGCSHYERAQITTQTAVTGCYVYTSSSTQTDKIRIQFRDNDRFTTLSECKQFFTDQLNNGTPVEVWYTVTDDYAITLTPSSIQILKGNNTLWIEDGGATIALTYKK